MLNEILAHKRSEVAQKKLLVPLRELEEKSRNLPPTRNFKKALMGSNAPNAPDAPNAMTAPYVPYGSSTLNESSAPYAPDKMDKMDEISIIAEIKKASPSRGIIRQDFDPLAIAQVYEQHGAAAISILTDRKFFQGDLGYLQQVRDITSIPLLRKDFIVDAYQIYEARVAGADALLLIAAALSQAELCDFFALASSLGLHVLLEVHNQQELERAVLTDAPIIGINNRDLKTFRVDLSVTTQLARQIPPDRVIVSESGIHDALQLRFLKGLGVNAVLVGEALMAKEDIGRAFQELVGKL
jgi:indole-3-glycerol phosphate synthase